MKYIIGLIISALVLSAYLGSRIHYAWNWVAQPEGSVRVDFEIPLGSSLKQISAILHQQGMIQDPWAFGWYVRWHDLEKKLQAGQYVLTRDMGLPEIIEALQSGRGQEMKITIPEGFTVQQIDQLLAQKLLLEPGALINCAAHCNLGDTPPSLEGYLFPSTYYVDPQQFSAENFLKRLYQTFQRKIQPYRTQIPSHRTVEQVVTVASMIEREAFGASMEEKQLIADVMWKRLDEGIPLGIDATTRYEKVLRDGVPWTTPLYQEDFLELTPYNTRRQRGLPPTAISNPGEAALKAAILPQGNEFYYYLHDRSGRIHFSKTLEEHNIKKRRYLSG